jgi:hypothetical protein
LNSFFVVLFFWVLPVAERTAGKGMRVDTLLLALDGRVHSHRMTDGTTLQPDSAFGAQETDFCIGDCD